jgi:PhzF family phenazine biosynthesis protein
MTRYAGFAMDHPAIFHFNAFCGPAGSGNPGAACMLTGPRPSEWMQTVAAQMNLPMTAFLHAIGPAEYAMRWFDSDSERPLCGHATLGAAHILWNDLQRESSDEISFQTAGGVLKARRYPDGIEISLPLNKCATAAKPDWLERVLGLTPLQVLAGSRMFLVELNNEPEVAELKPDFALLRRVADRGIIVTAHSDDPRYDCASRYFPGYAGNNEDHVTGSAHCCVVPFWSDRLGKRVIKARQLSARGGEMTGSVEGQKVNLRGQVRTVLRGDLLLD